jgi:hypothetical protein
VEVLERHLAQLAAKEHLSLESGSPSLAPMKRDKSRKTAAQASSIHKYLSTEIQRLQLTHRHRQGELLLLEQRLEPCTSSASTRAQAPGPSVRGHTHLSESRRQTPLIMVDTLSHAAQTKLVGPEHRPQWGINGQGSLSPVSVTPSPSLQGQQSGWQQLERQGVHFIQEPEHRSGPGPWARTNLSSMHTPSMLVKPGKHRMHLVDVSGLPRHVRQCGATRHARFGGTSGLPSWLLGCQSITCKCKDMGVSCFFAHSILWLLLSL